MESVIWNQRLILAPEGPNVVKAFIYCLVDASGQVIYVGSSACTPDERLLNHRKSMQQFLRLGTQSSPLTRGIAERGIDPATVTMRVFRWVEYSGDSDVVLYEEKLALTYFRRLGCPLLQKNSPIDTTKQRQRARAFRRRNPEYMRDYCKAWRLKRKRQAEAERAEAESTQAG